MKAAPFALGLMLASCGGHSNVAPGVVISPPIVAPPGSNTGAPPVAIPPNIPRAPVAPTMEEQIARGKNMAVNFIVSKYSILPGQAINILPVNNDRKYLLLSCSVLSLVPVAFVFRNYVDSNVTTFPYDSITLFQGGNYEPIIVPSNEISFINQDMANTANIIVAWA